MSPKIENKPTLADKLREYEVLAKEIQKISEQQGYVNTTKNILLILVFFLIFLFGVFFKKNKFLFK